MNHNEKRNFAWADVPGYEGRYIINQHGKVRRIYASCVREMAPYMKDGDPMVHLSDGKGKRRMIKVSRLVAAAYMPPPPRTGMVIYHINGVRTDNYVGNLKWISRQQLGRLTGSEGKRRAVVKISIDGVVVRHYSSAREAARDNYMSYQTIMDHCNRRNKRFSTATDGFIYRWDEDAVQYDADLENGMAVRL